MAQDSTTRRGYLKAAGVGIGALSLAGCVGGGGGSGDGNNDSGGGNGSGAGGGSEGGSNATSGGGSTDTESGGATEATSAGSENESSANASSGGSEDLPDSVSIGSDIPYRPFEYQTEKGELTGFDVDIGEAVFKDQLGIIDDGTDMAKVFQDTSFSTIIGSLNNGNFRVVMSAMTINEKRDKKVDFSDPYFTAYQTILVLKNSDITSKQDLKGKTVAVQKGTTGADAAEKLKKSFGGDLTIKRYDQIPAAFNALGNNQAVAVINDNTVNGEFADQNDNVQFVKGKGAAAKEGKNAPPYLTLTVEEYGIAFRQNDDAFRKRVNEALAAIRKDGTYDDIYAKYFKN